MRIAMVSEHASPLALLGGADAGGQNVHVAELATALGARGHQVDVFTRRDDPDLPDRVPFAPGVHVEHLTAGPMRPVPKDDLLPHIDALGAALATRLAKDPPDVVHAHFWMSGLAATAADIAPVVQTFHALGVVKRRHQGAHDTSPVSRSRAERRLARVVNRVLASCRDERAELLALGADPARLDVVPSGVDLEQFTPHGPAARRTPAFRALVVARLVPRKGVDDAVRACALVPGVELVVAGGPPGPAFGRDPEVQRLRDLIDELDVADRVTLVGSVERASVPALFRSADAVLCLPWYEPFGIVPVEAMACGVPVIGTAVGGLLDTVQPGRTGLHVPPRDPVAAAAALRRLRDDPARRQRLGRGGARSAERFGWRCIAEQVERSYLAAARVQEEAG